MKTLTESDILIACSEAIERAKPEYQAITMRDILLVKLKSNSQGYHDVEKYYKDEEAYLASHPNK